MRVTEEVQPRRVGRGDVLGARSAPLLTQSLCLSWQTWLQPQLVLLGWQPGKAMSRAGREVAPPSSILVQQGQGTAHSCRILQREVMLETRGRSMGEGGGCPARHE